MPAELSAGEQSSVDGSEGGSCVLYVCSPCGSLSAAIIINLWDKNTNNAVWITVCWVVTVGINLFGTLAAERQAKTLTTSTTGARGYGEAGASSRSSKLEFILS